MSISELELARLSDLAVEHLLDALGEEETREYEALRERHPEFDLSELEQSVAALQLAAMTSPDPLPERLRIRLATDAADRFPHIDAAPVRLTATAQQPRRLGWWAAAASVVAALLVWSNRPATNSGERRPRPEDFKITRSPPVAAPADASRAPDGDMPRESRPPEVPRTAPVVAEAMDAAAAREQMLAANRFVLHRAWRAGNDPAGRAVTGDVVWDPRTQRGYMRFVGLRPNNPNVEQYQLWIFDARRDERYPVDGGVFDISRNGGAEVIAIKTSLKVNVALMFAVTIERPGGVVVSDRTRIAALANSG